MKIRIIGAVLSALFLVIVGYQLFNIDVGIGITVTTANRLIDPITAGVQAFIWGLSQMLWQYRGIDMVIQAAFLFVAALAASVFFHEETEE